VSLVEIDLRGNLINDPNELIKLANKVPELEKLDLRGNPILSNLKEVENLCIKLFPSLRYINGREIAPPIRISNPKAFKGKRNLLAEIKGLKEHNNKLSKEVTYKSKLLINKSKDLTRTNEKLLELESELALYKLNSLSSRTLPNNSEQDFLNKTSTELKPCEPFTLFNKTIELERLGRQLNNASDKKFVLEMDMENCNTAQTHEPNKKEEKTTDIESHLEYNKEIESLKRDIKLKSEHLLILQRQMIGYVIEATLVNTEDFIIREEKASHDELLELIERLKEKEQVHFGVESNAQNSTLTELSHSQILPHTELKANCSRFLTRNLISNQEIRSQDKDHLNTL